MWHAIQRFLSITGLLYGFVWSGAAFGDESSDLQVGDATPEFQCRDDRGQLWNSGDFLGKKMVVVFFSPSDFSFCCTRQAVRYRDREGEFRDLGVEVVGISGDAVELHRQFQAAYKLNLLLLSDANEDIARKFGVPLRDGGKTMIAVPANEPPSRWICCDCRKSSPNSPQHKVRRSSCIICKD